MSMLGPIDTFITNLSIPELSALAQSSWKVECLQRYTPSYIPLSLVCPFTYCSSRFCILTLTCPFCMLPCTLSCFGSIMLDLILASSHVLGFHLQFSIWMCLPVYALVCEIHCPQPVHKLSLMRASVMKKKWREEGLPYADLLKVDLSVNPLCMCLCACVDAAQVLQGHEAVMHEKIKCTCAATPGHSWTDFHYCILKSGWVTSDKPDHGLKIHSLLGVER